MPTEAQRIALRQATRLNFEFITDQRETRLSRLHSSTAQSCPAGWDAGMPAGQTPVLAAPSKQHGLSMISAISNQGLVRFGFIEEAMNTDLFMEFAAIASMVGALRRRRKHPFNGFPAAGLPRSRRSPIRGKSVSCAIGKR